MAKGYGISSLLECKMEVFVTILMLFLVANVYEKTEACTCTSQANRTNICSADFGKL